MKRNLNSFIKKLFRQTAVSRPSELATQSPYKGGFALSGNNAFQALGAPDITFPGATGVKGGPSYTTLQKPQIVYGKREMGGMFDLGAGWTSGAFDRPPSGNLYNPDQA